MTTYIDIEKDAGKTRKEFPMLRKGQSLMNSLHKLCPDVYRKISGTKADCFYDDKNIEGPEGFVSRVYEFLSY
jgi:hypothetical protein